MLTQKMCIAWITTFSNEKPQLAGGSKGILVYPSSEPCKLTYLLLIVGCVWQHGGYVEHDLIILVSSIQRVGAS